MITTASTKDETVRKLVALIQRGKDTYYGGNPTTVKREELPAIPKAFQSRIRPGPMTDAVYDALEEFLEAVDPTNKILRSVGSAAAVSKKLRVTLPYPMSSLIKGKPDGSMQKWMEEHPGPYVVSLKLDGVSILMVYKKNQPVKLYTRGKNNVGGDISFMAPMFRIPQTLPFDLVVRGEAVMPLAKFKQWERKVGEEDDKNKFSNPRNMVAGITNRNDLHPGLKHVDIICYDLYVPRLPPSKALAKLKSLGFKTVMHKVMTNLTVTQLQNLLASAKVGSPHELDGLVVMQDKRNPLAADYPDYARAFKDEGQQQQADVKVTSVTWQTGRHDRLSSVVNIEPVKLGGVIIKNVSGGSAGYIYDNKIGPGAVITIIRSGDVIPKVIGVVRAAKAPQMPTDEYEWKGAHVFLKPKSANASQGRSVEQKVRTIEHFFASIGVERFKGATIAKFVNAGYDTVRKIIQAPASEFVAIPGTSAKVMQEVMEQMDAAIDDISLATLMAASGMFGSGFGKELCTKIVTAIPNIMEIYDHPGLAAQIEAVEGFGEQRATQFAANMKRFAKWLHSVPQINWVVPQPKKPKRGKMSGHVVVFTKVRDYELQTAIEAAGGEIGGSVTGKTTEVIAPAGENSTKLDAARAKGIPVLTIEQFKKRFGF